MFHPTVQKATSNISIWSANINTDRRVEKGYATKSFENWQLNKRIDGIFQYIKDKNYTIVSLCEVDATSLPKIHHGLQELGYQVVNGAYAHNQTPDYSFYFVVGYQNDEVKLIENYMYWFTATPLKSLTSETRITDCVLLENKEQFEKGSLICKYRTPTGTLVHSMNHFGLREPYQMASSTMLAAHLKSICYMDAFASYFEETHHIKQNTSHETMQIVVSGDFNTFPDLNGRTIEPFLKNDFIQQVDPYVPFSFFGYPYDLGLVKPEILNAILESVKKMDDVDAGEYFVNKILEVHGKVITSLLDHVFTLGIENAKYSLDTYGMNTNTLQEKFMLQAKNNMPFMLSDHFATIIEF